MNRELTPEIGPAARRQVDAIGAMSPPRARVARRENAGPSSSVIRERPFSSSFDAGRAMLRVSGVIDDPSLDSFREALGRARAAAGAVVTVDLSEVEYLPAAAISVLASVTSRSDASIREVEAYMLLATPGTIAHRVLSMCGMPVRTR